MTADHDFARGMSIAERTIGAIRAGASNPDALMSALLGVMADGGRRIPPTSQLRGFCQALRRHVKGSGDA